MELWLKNLIPNQPWFIGGRPDILMMLDHPMLNAVWKLHITVFLLLNHTRPYRGPGRVGIPPFGKNIEVTYVAKNLRIFQKMYFNCGFNIQIWPSVGIGLGNGLSQRGDKTLPNPMMIKTQPERMYDIPAVKLHPCWQSTYRYCFLSPVYLHNRYDKHYKQEILFKIKMGF